MTLDSIKNKYIETTEKHFGSVGIDFFESDQMTDEIYSLLLDQMHEVYHSPKLRDHGNVFLNGIYMPCCKRDFFISTTDPANDGAPRKCSLYNPDDKSMIYVERINRSPKHYGFLGTGIKYRLVCVHTDDLGKRKAWELFFQIKNNGDIRPAILIGGPESHKVPSFVTQQASLVINACADSDFLWECEIEEPILGSYPTKLKLGMNSEQIKSLFYARTLPVTESGRKRPIIHAVQSHKRRIKEGIDVNIKKHTRGVSLINLDGLDFKITPPKRAFLQGNNQ